MAEAQAYEEEGLVLSQELEYDKGEADASVLGRVAHIGWQDLDAADHYLERSLASYRTLGDPVGIASVLCLLAEIALYRADFPRARALAEDALTVARAGGLPISVPAVDSGLASPMLRAIWIRRGRSTSRHWQLNDNEPGR